MIDRIPQTDGAALADGDPRLTFASPQEIKNASGLSAVQKQQLLARWAEYAKADHRSNPAVAHEVQQSHSDLEESSAMPTDAAENERVSDHTAR